MEHINSFEKFKTWMKESLAVKLFVIFFTILILMIPKALIQELINERKYLEEMEIGRTQVLEQLATGAPLNQILLLLVANAEKLNPDLISAHDTAHAS